MKKKEKKRRKFARRLTWHIILVMTLINLFIINAVLFIVVVGTKGQSVLRSHDLINVIGSKLEVMLATVEATAVNNLAEVEANLDTPEKVFAALEKGLRLNKHYIGCFVAFEPNYFASQGRWFEPYVVYRDSVRIEKAQMGSVVHDYFKREWYAKGLNVEDVYHGYWSDPYFDADGAKAMLCSYVLPVRDKTGKRIGVFGIDLPLDWLSKSIRDQEIIKMNEELLVDDPDDPDDERTFYSFVIGRKGQYIVPPDKKGVLKGSFKEAVEATPDLVDDRILNKMLAGDSSMLEKIDINDTRYYISYSPLSHTGWTMAVAQHWALVYIWGIVLSIFIIFVLLVGSVIIFFTTRFSIWRATKPLRYLTYSVNEVAKGNFETSLPKFKHNDEISQLRDSFETMQLSLTNYVEELKNTTTSKATIESELRIAHDIQMSMLPKKFPPFPERNDIELFGMLTPAKAVGGDLYDFFIRDEKLFFCIGDVSGKGVPASLIMSVTRTLFRNIAVHTSKPAHIVKAINDAISDGNDANMFITVFVGVLDLPTGRLRYCNAGHDAPYIETNRLRCDANIPMGIIPGRKFSEQETKIASGTTIFLYTDGLTEAENEKHELFGKNRMVSVIESFVGEDRGESEGSPQELIEGMTEAVHQFVGDMEQSDDLTMLAIKFTLQKKTVRFKRRLVLHNDVQEVPQLAAFVDEVCEAVGFDASTTMKMNLAIEEAVVNVMSYAYPIGVRGEVRLQAEANDARMKIIISDDGMPFDPTEKPDVDITLSVEERSIGGLGIHLVRQIMDSINYEREGNQNIFTLRKKLK